MSSRETSSQVQPILVQGQPYDQVPDNLFIPPEALKVILASFEGPMDLLLYLVKRQNLNILDIPVATIADQYVRYIDLMQEMQLELAAEYLVMAAVLAELKSQMLLPKRHSDDAEEADPRAELIRRLQAYEQYRQLAELMDQLPRQERDVYGSAAKMGHITLKKHAPRVAMVDLLKAFKNMCQRIQVQAGHRIEAEYLSVRERMTLILERIDREAYVALEVYLKQREGSMGVVVTLLAILELLKQNTLDVTQSEPYQSVYIKGLA